MLDINELKNKVNSEIEEVNKYIDEQFTSICKKYDVNIDKELIVKVSVIIDENNRESEKVN